MLLLPTYLGKSNQDIDTESVIFKIQTFFFFFFSEFVDSVNIYIRYVPTNTHSLMVINLVGFIISFHLFFVSPLHLFVQLTKKESEDEFNDFHKDTGSKKRVCIQGMMNGWKSIKGMEKYQGNEWESPVSSMNIYRVG